VDLEEVKVRGAQALQTCFDGVEDGRAAQTALVDVVFAQLDLLRVLDVQDRGLLADGAEALGQQHELVPRDVVFLDGRADQLLRHAVRVHVGRVPCVEPAVVRALEELVDLVRVVDYPR